ncbi:MAG TPA: AI-2E family transporter [Vicinamibacterales bacterium]|nr:AI-2E family transporter [Vicinamibacterales bacterium]
MPDAHKRGWASDGPVKATEAPSDQPVVIHMPGDIRSLTLTVLAVIAGVLFLRWAAPVLIPVVVAILISYVLSPLVNTMEKGYIHRAIGAGVAVLLLVGLLGGGGYALSGQAVTIIDSVPDAAQRLRDRIQARQRDRKEGTLEKVQRAAEEIDRAAEEATTSPVPTRAPAGVQRVQIVAPAFRAIDYIWSGGRGALALVAQLTFVLFLVYFILVSGDLYKRKLVRIAGPTLTQKKATVQILDEINRQIGHFIRVQVIVNLIVAAATAASLWALGLENYVLWGLLAGVFNSIPYIGPLMVTAGLGIVAFLEFDDLFRTLTVCAVVGAITGLEGMLVRPALLSRASQINPVAIFLSLLVWSWLWGFWGTILAVPMVMMMKAASDRINSLQPLGELLSGGEPREPPAVNAES